MYCPKCYKDVAKSDDYCAHCGAELKAPVTKKEGARRGRPGDVVWKDKSRQGSAHVVMHSHSAPDWRPLKNWFKSNEDLAYGQMVIIAARWMLVGAGLLLALWNPEALINPENPDAMGDLRVQVTLILCLAMVNFFLHAQVLMRKPVLAPVAYAASAGDIAVISLSVLVGGGFDANPFVFYFPAVLALSVAFRTQVTFTFAGAAIAAYGLISLGTMGADDSATLITQLLMIAAVAFCGNVYWRSERVRRRAAAETREELRAQVRQEVIAR